MEFDFYTKYQQLDTGHLLALVAAPEKMQAAAMEAALKVLAEREVNELEISERKALHQTAVIAEAQRQKSRKNQRYSITWKRLFLPGQWIGISRKRGLL